ncbi:hypothetical protein IB238_23625 [Rhizobium sp. ARZ01]|uniref:hypothetical protein n=1 Tax=Rhizobium sp. ARZ01 TaxID=2769313 RepID=UPI0017814B53|nr:hypothetical protein [Rhizobium sp. ARZ01]MBD9375602.1 hypothetical protein [Rhizobium sp. ARZ01]
MTAEAKKEEPPRDEAAEVLKLHHGDAMEAIRTLLAERDSLEERLATAVIILGTGYTRGWRP